MNLAQQLDATRRHGSIRPGWWTVLVLLSVSLFFIAVADAQNTPLPGSGATGTSKNSKPASPAAPNAEDDEEETTEDHAVTPPTKTPASTTPVQGRAAIDALIDKAGKEPPEWWDSVELNYPQSLDLSWPPKAPPGGWNPNKNVSQYYISIINPNPKRHQEGCKLMHHILAINKDDKSVQDRAMVMLGRVYGVYLQDYARGAFWYRKAAKSGAMNGTDYADLAFYYWKLGNKSMALAEINNAPRISTQTVRVLGSMGEVDKALILANRLAGSGAEDAFMAAGDALRYNGRYKEAAVWYRKVLVLKPADPKKPGRLKRYQDRATANLLGIQALEKVDLKRVADGVYRSDSIGYRGPVTVETTVKDGRIESVKIVNSKEDWPLNALVTVPAQIIEKQSLKGIDTVSGATATAEAVLNGVGKALSGQITKP